MSEKEKLEEEIAENARNFLEVLSMDANLIMENFNEIYKRVRGKIESQTDKIGLDKNQLFELGEEIGVIRSYMKILNKIYNINKNINKEMIAEIIKNLDLFSSILIDFNNEQNYSNLEQNLEQRMLTFTDAVMELLEDILF